MSEQLTVMLDRISSGDTSAAGQLFPLVYGELRRQAALYMSQQRRDHTLQPTSLVHEAYVRLVGGRALAFQSRAHFYNAAAEAMRRVLVDHARSKSAAKRGGGRDRIDLDHADIPASTSEPEVDFEALDLAMNQLRAEDERCYRVVMLRYFAGLGEQEIARSLGLSVKTVQRDWASAKLFLFGQMRESAARA